MKRRPQIREKSAQRACIGVDPGHQQHTICVRRGLDLAAVAGLQNGLGGEDHGAAADEIAEQDAEQQRKPRGLQHRSCAVAMGGMSDLVRNDAGEFIGDSPTTRILEDIECIRRVA